MGELTFVAHLAIAILFKMAAQLGLILRIIMKSLTTCHHRVASDPNWSLNAYKLRILLLRRLSLIIWLLVLLLHLHLLNFNIIIQSFYSNLVQPMDLKQIKRILSLFIQSKMTRALFRLIVLPEICASKTSIRFFIEALSLDFFDSMLLLTRLSVFIEFVVPEILTFTRLSMP